MSDRIALPGALNFLVLWDHIGRPSFASTSAGTVVWRASYLPFGGVHATTGAPISSRFPGQWFQAEAGLHQNWMRDYDPTTGRYIEADPLGLIDGASVYGYTRQSPLRWIDPQGLDPVPSPPSNLPGGPYEPAGAGQRTGAFFGPKQSQGPRAICQYVPNEASGGMPGAKEPYWKFKLPGQSWQRYSTVGNPITPEQAHPGNTQTEDDSCWCDLPPKILGRAAFTLSLIFWASPAN